MVLGVDISYRNEDNRKEGEWISLPMSEDRLEDILYRYRGSDMTIDDYKCRGLRIEIDSSDSIMAWNRVLLKAYEDMAIFAIAEYKINDLNSFVEAIEERDRYTVYLGKTIEDVARLIIIDKYGDNPLIDFIDYKKYANLLHCEGYYETDFGVVVED